ncbi:MAG: sterol desaturase family protein [Deltaproteobacteria bacterium]|nr:sterol desaturase family protein [Deltaproteobacteria bacterium]
MSLEAIFQTITPVLLTGFFLVLFYYERIFPLRRPKRSLAPRLAVNLTLSALVFVVGGLVVRPVALGVSWWTERVSFGLLHFLTLPFWAQFVLGFLLMDLTIYYWHRINHTWPILWRFHNVHHVDPDLDVSTSFRFHFVEILYSALFRMVQVGLVGVAPLTYVVYELVFQVCTVFHHSNLHLPIDWERRINRALVTPRMHGVHHSVVGPETNSNYSVVFSWWDRLNRSLRLNVPQGQVIIGVPGYLQPQDNSFSSLTALPFLPQRPYWRWPSGKASVRKVGKASDNCFMEE